MTEHESVTLSRTYAVQTERLYEVLTKPEYMEQWFSPSPDIVLSVQQHERTVGAPYKFCYRQPDGSLSVVVGEYVALERPSLIAFTWGWTEPDPHAGISTLVTMTLKQRERGTDLTVLHEKLPAGDVANRHREGWDGTLDRLQLLIEQHDNTQK